MTESPYKQLRPTKIKILTKTTIIFFMYFVNKRTYLSTPSGYWAPVQKSDKIFLFLFQQKSSSGALQLMKIWLDLDLNLKKISHHVPDFGISFRFGRQIGLTCELKLIPASLFDAIFMMDMSLLYGPLRRNSGCITMDSIRKRLSYKSNFFRSWFPITKCKYGCCDTLGV